MAVETTAGPWMKFAISVIGIFLVTFSGYYTSHAGAWLGALITAGGAIGTYAVGLFQNNPFKKDQ